MPTFQTASAPVMQREPLALVRRTTEPRNEPTAVSSAILTVQNLRRNKPLTII
jgi:hypothetical protein